MAITRRGFLGGILAAAAAPAIVKAGVLMPVRSIIVPRFIYMGIDWASEPDRAGYVAFVHPNMARDIGDLPGFVPCDQYGGLLLRGEVGHIGEVRFIESAWLN